MILLNCLAKKDNEKVGAVFHATKRLFSYVGIAFIAYALLIAVFYNDLSGDPFFDRSFSFGHTVCVIQNGEVFVFLCIRYDVQCVEYKQIALSALDEMLKENIVFYIIIKILYIRCHLKY